ncbi:MAG: VOC family protein [Candidatus Eisenbacteria bacterium]
MKPRITVITLAVEDLERALRFYRDGLGLATKGIVGTEFVHGAVVFFDLAGGLKLALWPRASLAQETGLSAGAPDPTTHALAHNVATRAEVDALLAQAARAGASIVRPAQDASWGVYSGWFADPDGHLWEVAWNPSWSGDS